MEVNSNVFFDKETLHNTLSNRNLSLQEMTEDGEPAIYNKSVYDVETIAINIIGSDVDFERFNVANSLKRYTSENANNEVIYDVQTLSVNIIDSGLIDLAQFNATNVTNTDYSSTMLNLQQNGTSVEQATVETKIAIDVETIAVNVISSDLAFGNETADLLALVEQNETVFDKETISINIIGSEI